MKNRDTFSSFHPTVNFLYFCEVLMFTMLVNNPSILIISLVGSAAYNIYLNGRRAAVFQLLCTLPMVLTASLVNPAFNHEGATILAYLPSGNPLTLESILYGISIGVMLSAVLNLFSCYIAVMTSDKFVYLFGRVIPALSLVISMTLRFVPKFTEQLRTVREAQLGIGRKSDGKPFDRIKNGVAILSAMITWSLENAIETADSMRSRGYGLPGRTAFSIYRFDGRDRLALIWLGFCGFFVGCGGLCGGLYWRYFPTVRGACLSALTVAFQLAYFGLCLTPLIINFREDRIWKRLKSEI